MKERISRSARAGRVATLLLLATALPVAAQDDGDRDVAVTVYNQDLGLVHEARTISVDAGRSEVRYTDVAARLDPTSVHFEPAREGGFEVLEQNFQYDLASSDRLLERSLGETIRAHGKDGGVYEGRLVFFDRGGLILETADGIRMLYRGELRDQTIPSLPGGLVSKPTLSWLVEAPRGGSQKAELSYLTAGISWHAEYVAVVGERDDRLDLAAWVSIDNRSGATYPNARLKLVAGDIHRVRDEFEAMAKGRMAVAQEAQPFAEREFFEYHLYDLARRTTIADRETKQISLFEPAEVRQVTKRYVFDGRSRQGKVEVRLEFTNARESGLGMALPGGKVRVYKEDTDGTQQFVGEDRIDHTPRNEKVELTIGNAFDVVAERKQTEFRRLGERVTEQSFEISLRNRKREPVTVHVVERIGGDWEITRASHEYEKKDAFTVEFPVRVPADQEVKLTYTVRIEP